MTKQLGQQTTIIHILPEISKCKGNLTMKPEQLKEYNMRDIFLENACIKCVEETSPRSFLKKSLIGYVSRSIF